MRKIFFLLIIGLSIASCTEEISSVSLDTETAIVEGYLFAGQPLDSFKITQSFSYAREDTELITLDDLEVIIRDEENSYFLSNLGGGFYQNLDFIPASGEIYTLEFQHADKIVTATTYIPEKTETTISATSVDMEKIELTGGFPNIGSITEIDPIEITWKNPGGDYFYVVIENMEENPEYVNDLLAEIEASGLIPRFLQITEPEITDFYVIQPRRQLPQFGTYRIIVFRVNPEYAALYESEGSSSITITQPPSNINNGLGIFTGASSDTLFIEVNKR